MTAIFSDVEKYKFIDPRQVEAYLIAHGWQQQQRQGLQLFNKIYPSLNKAYYLSLVEPVDFDRQLVYSRMRILISGKRFADFGSNQTLANTSLHTDQDFKAIPLVSFGIVHDYPI